MKTRAVKFLSLCLTMVLMNWGCAKGQSVSVCGNDVCESDETVITCPLDCEEGVCGNGVCDPGESADNCSEDCEPGLLCGNGEIDSGEHCDGSNIQSMSCSDLNAGEGQLVCNSECHFDLSGCSGGCIDQCNMSGMSRCNGNLIERCQDEGSGCLSWAQTGDCAASDSICDDSGGGAVCASTCSDACTLAANRCLGNIIQMCQAGDNGCLQWSDQTDCSGIAQMCSFEDSVASCVPPCSDGCEAINDTMCIGEVVRVCRTGALGCKEWQDGDDCSATGKLCHEGVCECPVVCSTGDTQCSGDIIQNCTANTDGCLEFVDGTDCTATSEVCNGSSGTAVCAESCNDACTTGQTQCSGTYIQDCQTLTNGCLGWVSGVNCGTTGEICSGGTCQCDNECSSGDSECDSFEAVLECVQDSNNCWIWQTGENCISQGLLCVSLGGISFCF